MRGEKERVEESKGEKKRGKKRKGMDQQVPTLTTLHSSPHFNYETTTTILYIFLDI